jgi:deazaflavin-dependent oxidoreductase (nitroreductase family)
VAYLKPQAFTRHVVNPLVSRLHTGGVATLTVPGRRTGRARTVPVIPVEAGGIRYLVSPYGESQWVRNLRAAGKATLARKGKVETFQPSEVAVPGRAAIIAAHRKVCGRTVDPCFTNPCFTKLPDPSDHPVFRLDEIGASSRAWRSPSRAGPAPPTGLVVVGAQRLLRAGERDRSQGAGRHNCGGVARPLPEPGARARSGSPGNRTGDNGG